MNNKIKTSDFVIDTVAFVGKVAVENSSVSEEEKEFAKVRIDFGKELLKELTKTPEEKIIECAKKYSIQKITIDMYSSNFYWYTYFYIWGGDNISFCNTLGIKIMPQSENNTFEKSLKDNGFIQVWHKEYCFL